MADGKEKLVYVIAGPTASGKTAVAIRLAQHLGTEIVSADSRQCYTGMDIGTAKPSKEELAAVKHHFIDAFPVTQSLTAADYETLGLGYLNEIFKTRDTAVVCGGTGLYIKALCDGLDEMPPVDDTIVADVNEQYLLHGLQWLQKTMQMEDPVFFAKGEINNPARLIRALIFKRSIGESIIDFRSGNHKERSFRTVRFALDVPRDELYSRINKRVDSMMQQGLLDEVKSLQQYKDLKNLQTVGYEELFDYLGGKWSLNEAVEKIKQHTRNYAKRQFTWFRKDKRFTWLPPDAPLSAFLQQG